MNRRPLTTAAAPMGRRRFLQLTGLAGLAVGAAPILSACGSDDSEASADGTKQVAMQLSWIKNVEFAGEYFAIENGYWADAGLEVELIAGGAAGTGTEAGLDTGKVWVGTSTPDFAAPAILQGLEAKTIAATYQRSPFCITSGVDNPISTPQDMVGKKIGVQDTNTLVFDALLASNGLTRDDMEIVSVQFDPTPLSKGEVDGWVSYVTNEPLSLAANGFPNTTMLFADNGLPLVGESILISQQAIDEERDLVKGYLLGLIKGWKDAISDHEGAAKLAVEKYGKDLNLDLQNQIDYNTAQSKLIQSDETAENGILTISDEKIAQNIEALATADIEIAAEDLFDMSLITEVYEENPDLI
ncbi:secreted protein [Mumia flava]|uniref:Secreted protein n=1 Tax=Mumia flava TaxID=1348852 RepID=A0A0B2B351_9ACTN|nr:ABC transporter substrate-binding protein [Mumia flava]PJJ57901.1 secreted protein [Mumia flava]